MALASGPFSMIIGFLTWPLVVIGAFVGYKMNLKVEMSEADSEEIAGALAS